MSKPSFKDHFSGHAADYARFRPAYPDKLFEYLASLAPAQDLAWDCATGSGQAAHALATYFDQVIATDASARQIENALPHPAIDYRVEAAEATSIGSDSLDLITVAQALHWFDFDSYFTECQRVLKDNGIIAIIAYSFLNIEPEIDAVLSDFYHQTIGPYWPEERKYIDEAYASIPFPFQTINPPQFKMSREWSLDELGGYLRTWSATQHYIQERGHDPVPAVIETVAAPWGTAQGKKTVNWPLILKIGRYNA